MIYSIEHEIHTGDRRDEIHLLIAEDTAMSCQLLKDAMARSRSPIRVLASAQCVNDVTGALRQRECHVALISDSLSDGPLSGFRAIRELRESFPSTRPIMLMKSNHDELVVDAFRAGAKGVFSRDQPIKALTKCITMVHQGQVWANSAQLNSLLSALTQAAPIHVATARGQRLLTKRENDVTQLIAQGASNREISQKLGLTEHTVSNYLFRIYEKLGISSRVELVLYALGPQNE